MGGGLEKESFVDCLSPLPGPSPPLQLDSDFGNVMSLISLN